MSARTLPPADAIRLAKLLGMVGSAHDGEALNAARLVETPGDQPLAPGFVIMLADTQGALTAVESTGTEPVASSPVARLVLTEPTASRWC